MIINFMRSIFYVLYACQGNKIIDYSVEFDKIFRNLGVYTKARFTHYSMEPIPKDLLIQFDDILKQRNVPLSSHSDYRKWLRYFLDYRAKYSPPDAKSDQVRLFAEKLRSKNQTAKQLEEAADAVSLLFALQQRKGERTGETRTSGKRRSIKPIPTLILPLKRRKLINRRTDL